MKKSYKKSFWRNGLICRSIKKTSLFSKLFLCLDFEEIVFIELRQVKKKLGFKTLRTQVTISKYLMLYAFTRDFHSNFKAQFKVLYRNYWALLSIIWAKCSFQNSFFPQMYTIWPLYFQLFLLTKLKLLFLSSLYWSVDARYRFF